MNTMSACVCIAVLAAAPALAEEQQLPCVVTLVPCNYGDYFSGTAHMKHVERISAAADAEGKARESVYEVTATVKAGKVECQETHEGQAVKRAGRIAIERGISMEDAPDQVWYSISIACPEEGGELPSIDEAQIKTYKQADKTSFMKLDGKITDENVDEANGVTETTRTEWSFVRIREGRP